MDFSYLARGRRVDNENWIIGTARMENGKAYILPLDDSIIIDQPEYNFMAMGCGIEDNSYQKDGYAGAYYGWNDAIERYQENFPAWIEVVPETLSRCTGFPVADSYRGKSERERLLFQGDVIVLADDTFLISPIQYGIVRYGVFQEADSHIGFNVEWLNGCGFRTDIMYWINHKATRIVRTIWDCSWIDL